MATLSDRTLERLKDWPSPTGAGERLGMSRQAVLKALNEGRLRGVLTANGWLVDPADTERWRLEKRRRKMLKDFEGVSYGELMRFADLGGGKLAEVAGVPVAEVAAFRTGRGVSPEAKEKILDALAEALEWDELRNTYGEEVPDVVNALAQSIDDGKLSEAEAVRELFREVTEPPHVG